VAAEGGEFLSFSPVKFWTMDQAKTEALQFLLTVVVEAELKTEMTQL
jgi:hypothetical protein